MPGLQELGGAVVVVEIGSDWHEEVEEVVSQSAHLEDDGENIIITIVGDGRLVNRV